MAIPNDLLRAGIAQLSSVEGVEMSPEALVEDVVLLARVWPAEEDFAAAVAASARALSQIVARTVTPSPLKGKLEGWCSYHYQLRRVQGEAAVLRVVFRRHGDMVEVKGFGHRFKPADVYHRLVFGDPARPR